MTKAQVHKPSPIIDTDQYRRDFAAYHSSLEIAHFDYRAGFVGDLRVGPIYERYGHLFTLEAVAALRKAEANVPANLDTEVAGMRALVANACIGFLDTQAKELTDEIAETESSAKVRWQGESLTFFSVPGILANEYSIERRRDLYARWIDCTSENNDLRLARVEGLHRSACELGFGSYRDLFAYAAGTDFDQLAVRANSFLERTETPYINSLDRLIARDLPDIPRHSVQHADFSCIQRLHGLDQYFPARNVMSTYESSMKGLGINVGRQQNIHIDNTSRPLKHSRASCLRVNPPDDVRLLLSPIGGASDYMTLFHEAGHAQHLAWTSRELATRHPEFVYSPDNATTETFAFLLNNLFHDARWVKEHRPGLTDDQSRSIASDLALLGTHALRRQCAKLRYDILLHDSVRVNSEQLAATYAELQNTATGYVRSSALYLSDVDDGFYSSAYLRAWALEAGLREYLRTRYGYRWWASRKAGDELIDLWSTSSRYSVEELSGLLGLGELDFDLLAETCNAAMTGE